MKTKTQHTPTPWTVRLSRVNTGSFYEIEKDDFPVATVGAGNDGKYDAEFIVRAVNSHEALISAVQAAIIHVDNDKVKEMLKNIVARAEGK